MTWVPDDALEHLRRVVDEPELNGTRYTLVRPLGRGGMGVVWLVRDEVLVREVALKVVSEPEIDPAAVSRMRREARILAGLEHPGIVPVHDVGVLPDGRAFYVMKRVEGERLDHWLAGTDRTLDDRLRVVDRICDTLSFAHARGVIHRDLKPENVMIGPFGEVLVLDWGVAKLLREPAVPDAGTSADGAPAADRAAAGDATTLTARGTIVGTPSWMAPEQAAGKVDAVNERTDVHAVGLVLAFLLTARRAPENESAEGRQARLRAARVPKPLAAVVRKATAEEPGERYGSVAEVAGDLRRFAAAEPVLAYPEPVHERMARWIRRNRGWIALVLAYLLVRTVLALVRAR